MRGGRESKSSGSSHREEKGGSFSDESKGFGTAQWWGEHPHPMLLGYRKGDGRWNTRGKFPTEYILCGYGCPRSNYENRHGYTERKKGQSMPKISWRTYSKRKHNLGDFPGGLGVRTPNFQCRGCGFHSWSGTKMPHAVQCSQKEEENSRENPNLKKWKKRKHNSKNNECFFSWTRWIQWHKNWKVSWQNR